MFKNPLSMKRHVETFHDEEKKAEMVVVCPNCGKQFNKRENLKIHMECVYAQPANRFRESHERGTCSSR